MGATQSRAAASSPSVGVTSTPETLRAVVEDKSSTAEQFFGALERLRALKAIDEDEALQKLEQRAATSNEAERLMVQNMCDSDRAAQDYPNLCELVDRACADESLSSRASLVCSTLTSRSATAATQQQRPDTPRLEAVSDMPQSSGFVEMEMRAAGKGIDFDPKPFAAQFLAGAGSAISLATIRRDQEVVNEVCVKAVQGERANAEYELDRETEILIEEALEKYEKEIEAIADTLEDYQESYENSCLLLRRFLAEVYKQRTAQLAAASPAGGVKDECVERGEQQREQLTELSERVQRAEAALQEAKAAQEAAAALIEKQEEVCDESVGQLFKDAAEARKAAAKARKDAAARDKTLQKLRDDIEKRQAALNEAVLALQQKQADLPPLDPAEKERVAADLQRAAEAAQECCEKKAGLEPVVPQEIELASAEELMAEARRDRRAAIERLQAGRVVTIPSYTPYFSHDYAEDPDDFVAPGGQHKSWGAHSSETSRDVYSSNPKSVALYRKATPAHYLALTHDLLVQSPFFDEERDNYNLLRRIEQTYIEQGMRCDNGTATKLMDEAAALLYADVNEGKKGTRCQSRSFNFEPWGTRQLYVDWPSNRTERRTVTLGGNRKVVVCAPKMRESAWLASKVSRTDVPFDVRWYDVDMYFAHASLPRLFRLQVKRFSDEIAKNKPALESLRVYGLSLPVCRRPIAGLGVTGAQGFQQCMVDHLLDVYRPQPFDDSDEATQLRELQRHLFADAGYLSMLQNKKRKVSYLATMALIDDALREADAQAIAEMRVDKLATLKRLVRFVEVLSGVYRMATAIPDSVLTTDAQRDDRDNFVNEITRTLSEFSKPFERTMYSDFLDEMVATGRIESAVERKAFMAAQTLRWNLWWLSEHDECVLRVPYLCFEAAVRRLKATLPEDKRWFVIDAHLLRNFAIVNYNALTACADEPLQTASKLSVDVDELMYSWSGDLLDASIERGDYDGPACRLRGGAAKTVERAPVQYEQLLPTPVSAYGALPTKRPEPSAAMAKLPPRRPTTIQYSGLPSAEKPTPRAPLQYTEMQPEMPSGYTKAPAKPAAAKTGASDVKWEEVCSESSSYEGPLEEDEIPFEDFINTGALTKDDTVRLDNKRCYSRSGMYGWAQTFIDKTVAPTYPDTRQPLTHDDLLAIGFSEADADRMSKRAALVELQARAEAGDAEAQRIIKLEQNLAAAMAGLQKPLKPEQESAERRRESKSVKRESVPPRREKPSAVLEPKKASMAEPVPGYGSIPRGEVPSVVGEQGKKKGSDEELRAALLQARVVREGSRLSAPAERRKTLSQEPERRASVAAMEDPSASLLRTAERESLEEQKRAARIGRMLTGQMTSAEARRKAAQRQEMVATFERQPPTKERVSLPEPAMSGALLAASASARQKRASVAAMEDPSASLLRAEARRKAETEKAARIEAQAAEFEREAPAERVSLPTGALLAAGATRRQRQSAPAAAAAPELKRDMVRIFRRMRYLDRRINVLGGGSVAERKELQDLAEGNPSLEKALAMRSEYARLRRIAKRLATPSGGDPMGMAAAYEDLEGQRDRLRAQVAKRDGGPTLLQILDAEAEFECDTIVGDAASAERCAADGCDFRKAGYVLNASCYDPETQRLNLLGAIVDRDIDDNETQQSEKFEHEQVVAFRRARQLERRLQAKLDSADELRRTETALTQLLERNPALSKAFEAYREIGPLKFLAVRRALESDSEEDNAVYQQLQKSFSGRELIALAIAEYNANRWDQFASPTGASEDDLNTACENVSAPSVDKCESVGCGFAEARGWLFNKRQCVDEELMLSDLGIKNIGLNETLLYRLIEVFYLIDRLKSEADQQRANKMRQSVAAFGKANPELATVLQLYEKMGADAFRKEIERLNTRTQLNAAKKSASTTIQRYLPGLNKKNLATAAKALLAIGALTALHFSAMQVTPEQPISTMQDFYNNYWYDPQAYDKPEQAQTMAQIISAILGL